MPLKNTGTTFRGGNSDTVDGYHATQTPTAERIPVSLSTGKLASGWIDFPSLEATGITEPSIWVDEGTYIRPNNLANSGEAGFRIYDSGYSLLGQVSPTVGPVLTSYGSTDGTVLRINSGNATTPTASENPPLWVKRYFNYAGTDWYAGAAYFGVEKTEYEGSVHGIVVDVKSIGGTIPIAGGVLSAAMFHLDNQSCVTSGEDIHNLQVITYTPSIAYESHHTGAVFDINNMYGDYGWLDDYANSWVSGVRVSNESPSGYHIQSAYSMCGAGAGGMFYVGLHTKSIAYDAVLDKGEAIFFDRTGSDANTVCMRSSADLEMRAENSIIFLCDDDLDDSGSICFKKGSLVGATQFGYFDNSGYLLIHDPNEGNTSNDSIDAWHVNHSENGDRLRVSQGSGTPNTTSSNPPVWVQHWCNVDQAAIEDQTVTGGLFESIKGAGKGTHNALVGNARATGGTGGCIGVQGRASTTVDLNYTIVGVWAACDTPSDRHTLHCAALELNMFNNYADAGEKTNWNDTNATIGLFCNNYTNKSGTGHNPISYGAIFTASELPDRISYWGYHRGIQIEACKEYAIYITDSPSIGIGIAGSPTTALKITSTCTTGIAFNGATISGAAIDIEQNTLRFASWAGPGSPVTGDVWFDNGDTRLHFYDGGTENVIAYTSDIVGNLWTDAGTHIYPNNATGVLLYDTGQLTLNGTSTYGLYMDGAYSTCGIGFVGATISTNCAIDVEQNAIRFAAFGGPGSPTAGDVWYDSGDSKLHMYTSAEKVIAFEEEYPAAFVYMSGTQAITTATITVVDWATEAWDTGSDFNLTTERFTPGTAGYYLITFNATLDAMGLSDKMIGYIYQNGAVAAKGVSYMADVSGGDLNVNVTTILYFNGSTDYVDFRVYHNYGANRDLSGNRHECYAAMHRLPER